MLVRYRRFRHILIFERRAWPDRLAFALSLGIPLAAGVVARLLLHYDAADLTLEGIVPRRADRRPVCGRHGRRPGRHPAARRRRVHRAALRHRLRVRGRRPARALPERGDLALLAVRVHRPAPAGVADAAQLPGGLAGRCCCWRRSPSSCCARAWARAGAHTTGCSTCRRARRG